MKATGKAQPATRDTGSARCADPEAKRAAAIARFAADSSGKGRLESAMWKRLRPYLVAAKLDPIRVENPIHPGTPDVNLATGVWIELKAVADWPKRARMILAIRHYTPAQRVWLYRRWRAGGRCFLLLRVVSTNDWLLFDGDVAARVVGRCNAETLRVNARAVLPEPALVLLEGYLRCC